MVLFLARMKKIQSKMKALECSQHFSHCKSIKNQKLSGSLLRSAWSDQSRVYGCPFLPARMKKIRSKMKALECSQHYTMYIDFSDAQGQITSESVVVFGRNLKSSKLQCISSSPARIKMIQSKKKRL